MIIQFSPDLFTSSNPQTQQAVAEILRYAMRKEQILDVSKLLRKVFFDDFGEFIFKNNPIATDYLSKAELENLKYYLKRSANLTKLYKTYLTTLRIGEDDDEVSPNIALCAVEKVSYLVLENGINDLRFIQGVCNKYTSFKPRKEIYEYLKNALDKKYLISKNLGGIGEMIKTVNDSMDEYGLASRYKLMALFDSDKLSASAQLNSTNVKIIEHFKRRNLSAPHVANDLVYEHTDILLWHMLFKRKLENYLPLNVLFKYNTKITSQQKQTLSTYTPTQLDYFEYSASTISLSEKDIKDLFPKYFNMGFSYRELEQNCSHHQVYNSEAGNISEHEQILLKIVKIV